MNDETLEKVFKTSNDYIRNSMTERLQTLRQAQASSVAREHYYVEITQSITKLINDIVSRGRQQQVSRDFYEKELAGLLTNINGAITGIKTENQRLIGAITAYEDVLEKLSKLPDFYNTELSKARDIVARAENGDLNKPRKLGTRPDKIKDIRNYAPGPEKNDAESSD